MLDLRLADAHVNVQADALNSVYSGAQLQIFDGQQPFTADTAVGQQNLLLAFTLPTPCFAMAMAGIVVAEDIPDTIAVASGTASWYRIVSSSGLPLQDGSVGTKDCNLNMDSTAISAGVTQHMKAWALTVPKG